jgi:cleavage and polyadenylation specificity factor subunit 1
MTLLPSTLSPTASPTNDTNPDEMDVDTTDSAKSPPPETPNHVLLTTQTGVLGLLTPIDEQTYRRLGALQVFLTNSLEHACGLNPRGYRSVETERSGSRAIVDGTILRRWTELGSQRKAEACLKVGVEEWVVRGDLERVGAGALGYF